MVSLNLSLFLLSRVFSFSFATQTHTHMPCIRTSHSHCMIRFDDKKEMKNIKLSVVRKDLASTPHTHTHSHITPNTFGYRMRNCTKNGQRKCAKHSEWKIVGKIIFSILHRNVTSAHANPPCPSNEKWVPMINRRCLSCENERNLSSRYELCGK